MRILIACLILSFTAISLAQSTQPVGKLPHLEVDLIAKQVKIDAEALAVDAPLEFFCVVNGTNEHEAVLRSPVKPSDLHLALLMLGLKPGEPARYSPALDKRIPPHGPPLNIFIEWTKDGKTTRLPAYRFMRDIKTKKEMPAITWIFAGSRVVEGGQYAADTTGYLISIVNFDFTVIDIPTVASNANETLEWERNADLLPPAGTKLTMILEPTGGADLGSPASASPATKPTENLSDVTADVAKMDKLRQRWNQAVSPHAKELREAAQSHYEVINAMRREQQRLIDEADRIQRTIDELEKDYQNMTTPRPEPLDVK